MAVRHGDETAGALPLPYLAEQPVGGGDLVQLAEHGFVDGDIDDLAAPGFFPVAQGHHDADGAVQAGKVVAERHRARHDRGFAGKAGQIGQAAESVGDVGEAGAAAIRPGLAVARHPQEDQARIGLAEHRPAEAPLLHRARPEILDEHIRLRDQPEEELHAFPLAQVDGDRLPVAGLAEPGQGGVVTLGRRSETAHRIAGDGVLDFQDFGAEFAQHRRGVRSGQEGAQIQHPNAGHRQFGLRVVLVGFGKLRTFGDRRFGLRLPVGHAGFLSWSIARFRPPAPPRPRILSGPGNHLQYSKRHPVCQ